MNTVDKSEETRTGYDSKADTLEHIRTVQNYLNTCAIELMDRGIDHDASKLFDPEKAEFDRLTPRLRSLTYGSPEYKESLAELKTALDHHYARNSHHPEHESMQEDWRDVVDYEGYYQVSNLGRVRSVTRVVERSGPTGPMVKHKMIRKAHVTPRGYVRICLAKDGVSKNHMVHTLVAKAFIGVQPSNRHQVNHLDGVKTNNRLPNLEWATPSQNLQHAYDTELRDSSAKYIFVCEQLGLSTIGANKMEEECRKLGYTKVVTSGIWRSAMEGGYHQDLSFSAFRLSEDFPYSGINGMNLFDVLEMLMDWKAASERHEDGNILKSLEINTERFAISPQLKQILLNTINFIFPD